MGHQGSDVSSHRAMNASQRAGFGIRSWPCAKKREGRVISSCRFHAASMFTRAWHACHAQRERSGTARS